MEPILFLIVAAAIWWLRNLARGLPQWPHYPGGRRDTPLGPHGTRKPPVAKRQMTAGGREGAGGGRRWWPTGGAPEEPVANGPGEPVASGGQEELRGGPPIPETYGARRSEPASSGPLTIRPQPQQGGGPGVGVKEGWQGRLLDSGWQAVTAEEGDGPAGRAAGATPDPVAPTLREPYETVHPTLQEPHETVHESVHVSTRVRPAPDYRNPQRKQPSSEAERVFAGESSYDRMGVDPVGRLARRRPPLSLAKSDFLRAVVLSEILGPPRARKPHRAMPRRRNR